MRVCTNLVPHNEFPLDVFVFDHDQSVRTRRFELSVWESRPRRQDYAHGAGAGGPGVGPGILPLESCVAACWVRPVSLLPSDDRPLLPGAASLWGYCFLGSRRAVHTAEVLTLTDIETQHALTLRHANYLPVAFHLS